mgnify:CR=1 FL=1
MLVFVWTFIWTFVLINSKKNPFTGIYKFPLVIYKYSDCNTLFYKCFFFSPYSSSKVRTYYTFNFCIIVTKNIIYVRFYYDY